MPVTLFACVASACGGDPPTEPNPTPAYEYTVPPETGDGWRTSSLSDVGLNESRFGDLMEVIQSGIYANVHGIVVVKDDRLVFEEYFDGRTFQAAVGTRIVGEFTRFHRDRPHNLASVTKSITSTLVGIAIDRGLIGGVDTAVYDFFPEFDAVRDARKDSITLHHVLTMTAGLDWDESSFSYGDGRNDMNALFSQDDPLQYILAKDAVNPPGTAWVYNGGGTNLLGQVVQRAAGVPLEDFANEHLFAPLGIAPPTWVRLPSGMTYTSGDLRLRPRDMAKIGYVFLNDGRWDGRAIVSPEWIAQATARHEETWNPRWGYGYQWWIFDYPANDRTYRSFGARGWGGQLITVFPEIELVVVTTGGNYFTSDPADAMIRLFVLDALG